MHQHEKYDWFEIVTPPRKPERLNIAQVILFFVMGVPAFAAVFYWIIVYGGLRGIPE